MLKKVNTVKKMKSKLIIISIILCLINCNSYKYGANAEPTQKSNLTFGVVKSKVKRGQTTQAEILKLFGSPNLITKNKSNNEVWSYNKMSVQNKEGATVGATNFWTGVKASQSSSSQSFDLIIIFDNNDVVINYSVISTNF